MYYIKRNAFYPVGDTVKDSIETGFHQGKKEPKQEPKQAPQKGKAIFAFNPVLQKMCQQNQYRPDDIITNQPGRKTIDKDLCG